MFKEVKHIPYLKRNLILSNKLDGEGYVISFQNNTQKIDKFSKIVSRGDLIGTSQFITITYNYGLNLTRTHKKNANKDYHKFGERIHVGVKKNIGKGISKGK